MEIDIQSNFLTLLLAVWYYKLLVKKSVEYMI